MFKRPRFPILRAVVLFIPLHALASALQLMFVAASLGLMLALLLAAQGVSGQGEPPPSAAAEFVAPTEIVLLPPTPIAGADVIVVETEVAAGMIETPFPQSTDTPPPPAIDAPVLAATATETLAATATETPRPTATETTALTATATETTAATATEPSRPTATETPALAATATETTATIATETPQPTATETPALTATPTATTAGPDATPTDTPSPALPAPPLPTVAPTPTPGASFWPRVLLTEFLADPKAVADSAGEWVELYNPSQEAVNLAGWNLADADGERHTIVGELWLPSGAYLVMGRSADRAVNGGAPVEYVYRGFTLANSADEIFLFGPNSVETDRVVWGDNGGLIVTPGSSLERTDWTPAAAWATARSPWPGSAGDNGSPRGSYRPPDLPTVTGTATLPSPPSATPSPTITEDIAFMASATPTELAPVLPSPTDTPWPTVITTAESTATAALTAWAPALPTPTDAPLPTTTATVASTTPATPTEPSAVLPTPTDTPLLTITATAVALASATLTEPLPVLPMPTNTPWPTTTATTAPTATGTPTVPATSAPTIIASATAATTLVPPTSTPLPTLTAEPPTPAPTAITLTLASRLLITEFLADPKAVADNAGEWVELHNPNPTPVNLLGWSLADADGERYTIAADLWLDAGAYLVLGRNNDRTQNGGAPVRYVYSGFALANSADELILLAPDGVLVDELAWGAADGLTVTPGASLERTTLDPLAAWTTTTSPWTDSAGDFGSPGAPYAGLAVPTPTAAGGSMLPTPTNTPWPTVTAPATPTVTATATGAATLIPPISTPLPTLTDELPTPTPASRLLITEFLANPKAVADSVGEWVELHNPNSAPVNLLGWSLADAGGERHTIAADLWLDAGAYLVLGRNGDRTMNGGAPVSYVYSGLALANSADELILLAPNGALVDELAWGAANGLIVTPGASLERTTLGSPATWTTATSSWHDSAGDFGSPGAPYVAPGEVTETPGATPTPAGTAIVSPTPASTPSPATTVSPSPPTGTPSPVGTLPSSWQILITEFLADPKAVADNAGEWVELHNTGLAPVNLSGWVLADAGSETHVITDELRLAAGAYVVLGRSTDNAVNGGAPVAYAYRGFTLANSADEIILFTPEGAEMDRAAWGSTTGLAVKAGASLERTPLDGLAMWVTAAAPWPGSAGDAGSPGMPNPSPPAALTPTPPATPGAEWPPASTTSPLAIEEVNFRGSDEEFIALANPGAALISLAGYAVGDAGTPGAGEGLYALLPDAQLAPNAVYVAARRGAAFRSRFGRPPDAEWEDTDPAIPDLMRRTDLASGALALNDAGDEVVLLNAAGELVDALAYGNGNYSGLHLTGELRAGTGLSLQRVPTVASGAGHDIRHRFLFAPPAPFTMQGLPTMQAHANPPLDGGYLAVWGSLGIQSNFSADGVAPPDYLMAAAGAAGLDFVALADTAAPEAPSPTSAVAYLPAWRWSDPQGNAAILYAEQYEPNLTREDLSTYVVAHSALVQWQAGEQPTSLSNWIAFPADAEDLTGIAAWFTRWQNSGRPLLPAGNSSPGLLGNTPLAPRYTGLAARSTAPSDLTEALAAQRGWLTSAPGLSLALYAAADDGQQQWMGGLVAPANTLTLHVLYGDITGQPAGLAIWQDGRPIRQLDTPPPAGHWSLQVPAISGATLVAVASQADGDFAVTAPILVGGLDAPAHVLINEALPAPLDDLNGDQKIDGEDEFIELLNLTGQPVDLSKWQLSNTRTDSEPNRRFTFKAGSFIRGGERLVLWRKETRLNLNGLGDSLRLLRPDGEEVDFITWDEDAIPGRSVARVPDGGPWSVAAAVTPGRANAPGRPSAWRPGASTGANHSPSDKLAPGEPTPAPTLEPTYGQAGGPPGSVAQAKLAGLNAWVEFRAVVTLPPGLITDTIYVADPVGASVAGLGVRVYLRQGDFPPLVQGDWVLLRGRFRSFRGELELSLDTPSQVWKLGVSEPLLPLQVELPEIGEKLEGRLITVTGVVSGWQGASIFLIDPVHPISEPLRVMTPVVAGWRRPYVRYGERWTVTGVVSQSARAAPWNGGYRVLALTLEKLPVSSREIKRVYHPPGVSGP